MPHWLRFTGDGEISYIKLTVSSLPIFIRKEEYLRWKKTYHCRIFLINEKVEGFSLSLT